MSINEPEWAKMRAECIYLPMNFRRGEALMGYRGRLYHFAFVKESTEPEIEGLASKELLL